MTQPVHHYITAPEDRISIPQKIAYSLGALVNNMQAAALGAMVVILNLGLGMNPALVGIIGFVPRLVDAVTDPVVGHISDNTRTRFGRRRPYLFWGAIFSGIIFALMWQPPAGQTQNFYFWFFLLAETAFFLAYAVYSIPFIALGYELSPDYHERTRLQGFGNFVGNIAWIIAPWFYKIMQDTRLFENSVKGARFLAVVVGAFILVGGVMPAIFTRERAFNVPLKDEAKKVGKIKGSWEHIREFFKAFLVTFKSRPFIKLCAATFLVFNGYMLASTFTLYVMIYYVFGGNTDKGGNLLGWFGSLSSICTFCVIPLTTWISTRLGKKRTFLITISISVVGYAMKWVGYNPDYPYLLLAAAPLAAFGLGSLFTLMGAMVADVCDLDELETGKRREGMFGAVYWWMVKLGLALAGLIGGFLLNASGFDVALGAVQSTKALFLLRVFDVGIPVVSSAVAILIILTFNVTEEKAHETRLELEARRGKAVVAS
jgi:GPH family glycoside/pentoside/hexuronide:cation symporter